MRLSIGVDASSYVSFHPLLCHRYSHAFPFPLEFSRSVFAYLEEPPSSTAQTIYSTLPSDSPEPWNDIDGSYLPNSCPRPDHLLDFREPDRLAKALKLALKKKRTTNSARNCCRTAIPGLVRPGGREFAVLYAGWPYQFYGHGYCGGLCSFSNPGTIASQGFGAIYLPGIG